MTHTKRWFEPREDITAYELAEIVKRADSALGSGLNHGVMFTDEQWSALPENIKRHFR